jgi:RNA polymerase sigma factor (sigma-70 family)
MPDWHQLREQFGPLVWTTVYRILADHAKASDCFQDVFAEVLEHASPDDVRAWAAFLRWLAVRRALNRLRKRRNEAARRAESVDVGSVATTSGDPAQEADWNELVERVRQAAARLPGHQGEAFWLRCVEQRDYAEIGSHLGIDANAVGVLIHCAKSQLRKVLADLNPVKH